MSLFNTLLELRLSAFNILLHLILKFFIHDLFM